MSTRTNFAGAASVFVRFLHWWKRELNGLVPGFVRALWRPKTLIVSLRERTVELVEERWRAPRVLGSAGLDDDQQLTLLARRANRIAKARGAKVGLRLAQGQCLVRQLILPVASRSRLEAMVRLELERLLPNDASNITYDWVTHDRQAVDGRMPVDLVVCKRPLIQGLIARLDTVRLRPEFIDCWRDESSAYGVDLSSDGLGQPRLSGGLRRLRTALAVTAAALILAAPLLWHAHRASVLDQLDTRIEEARTALQSERAEGDRRGARRAAAHALVQLRSEHPLMIALWAEIARALPDDAYAEEVSLERGRLTVDGRAKSAAALVPALERSALFKAAGLSSSVVLEPESGLERFTITLELEQGPTTASIPAEGAIQ